MHSTHGMGYAEYNRTLDNRLEVENSRQKDYETSQKIVEQFING